MMYGELAKASPQYQSGHRTGSIRAYGNAIVWFEVAKQRNPRKKYTADEIVNILKSCKDEWLDFCDTFGMGVDDEEGVEHE